ncbi:MAG: TonB-dependent receptor plug domain-containing protein, partial [Brevundimonas sp.]|nr:TonB-dependent receptor plug domain-containing protein [Brevundimonas sp.]
MNRLVKTVLLAGAAWSALSVTAIAQEAPAQDPAVTALDEIIVTARRRDEQLKDVPVAVTALSSERLAETGATDITTLQQQTPNATVQVARGSNSTLISFIRGVGQQDPLWGFEPGVGLYVDDVYVARPQAAVLDIFDIERIEVLRGPQGSLYGRNTVGGAIKYVTSRLSQDAEATIRGAYGSYNQVDLVASGSVPLSDTFRIGGAFAVLTRDGYGSNLNTGAEHYNKDLSAFRFSAEYTPTDDLFFRVAYDRTQDDSNPRHGHREVAGVGAGAG